MRFAATVPPTLTVVQAGKQKCTKAHRRPTPEVCVPASVRPATRGDDKGAPMLSNTIRKVAEYIRANSEVHARTAPAAKESRVSHFGDHLHRLTATGARA